MGRNKRNGFYYFMVETRKKEEANGRLFATIQDAVDFAGTLWTKLSKEEKESYEAMAHRTRADMAANRLNLEIAISERNDEGCSASTSGVVEPDLEKLTMVGRIQAMVNSLRAYRDFRCRTFFMMHANYFYMYEETVTLAEVALVEVNLGFGIVDTMHALIHPGQVRETCKAEAVSWALKTHHIPLQPNLGQRDFKQLFDETVKFLTKKSDEIPLIFTMPDSREYNTNETACKYYFKMITEAAGQDANMFRVYPLPVFLHKLQKKCVQSQYCCKGRDTFLTSPAVAEEQLNQNPFKLERGLSCAVHKDLRRGAYHCSLSFVKRWAFTLCFHCSVLFSIELIPGRHFPYYFNPQSFSA